MILISKNRSGAAFIFAALLLGCCGHAAADDVIADDLIVQGKACVGPPCVNGESFGTGTLRLKDTETRIDFINTNTSPFAPRDWRIEANSVASGGAQYLAIKDMGDSSTGAEGGTALFTATAGAPENSIFIDNLGRVGFRTGTPQLQLHAKSGNTPAIRFEQDATAGNTAQIWDVGGNEAGLFFARDVTGGGTLPFRIRPGAPTSSIDIAASGNVGIGTANPGEGKLQVTHTSAGSETFGLVLKNEGLTANTAIALGFVPNGALVTQRGAKISSRQNPGGNVADLGFFTSISDTPAERLTITAAGNVGIRTANPGQALQVVGNIKLDNVGGSRSLLFTNASNDGMAINHLSPGNTGLSIAGAGGGITSAYFDRQGNVGIGDTSPASLLTVGNGDLFQVNGSGAIAAVTGVASSGTITVANTNPIYQLGESDFDGNLYGLQVNSNVFSIGRNLAQTLNVYNDNIGIGTASPGAQLHTTGSVRFAGVANCSAGIVSDAAGILACAASSARFKDIRGALSAETAIANVMALKPQVGSYKETPGVPEHWLIAEEVAAVDTALAGFRDGEPYTVKTQNVVTDLVAVIQEQQRQLQEQHRLLQAQQGRIEALERTIIVQ